MSLIRRIGGQRRVSGRRVRWRELEADPPPPFTHMYGQPLDVVTLREDYRAVTGGTRDYGYSPEEFERFTAWPIRRLKRLRFPLKVWRGLIWSPGRPGIRLTSEARDSWSWDPKAARAFALGLWDPTGSARRVCGDGLGTLGIDNWPVILQGIIEHPEDVNWSLTIASMLGFGEWRRGNYDSCGQHAAEYTNVAEREISCRKGSCIKDIQIVFNPFNAPVR